MPKPQKNTILKLRRHVSSTSGLSFIVKAYKSLLKIKSYTVLTKHKPVSLSKKVIHEYNKTRTAHNYKYLCHAPFTNLFFSYDGKIGVCCYNRSNIFGTWPATSISDAWNCDQMIDLRKKMLQYDLSAGCYCCQIQWEEKAYATVLDDIIYEKVDETPELIGVEINSLINTGFDRFVGAIRKMGNA